MKVRLAVAVFRLRLVALELGLRLAGFRHRWHGRLLTTRAVLLEVRARVICCWLVARHGTGALLEATRQAAADLTVDDDGQR